MGKTEKKYGKGRLDHYYHLAKQKGYRARSSFKIIQINQKFGHFLEKSKVVIDLCAAPGSWCQVASQCCPINSLIIGVDLAPIKPLPNVISFQSDITTEHCRTNLKIHMKHWKADTVMHDGAPNVGMAWTQDAYTQSELTLQALKLAVEFLVPGGTFVTKIFRSRDYNKLMWVMQQLFETVQATKPPSSRQVSAEVFLVCQKFKNAKIDPRLLDSKYVFEELEETSTDYNKAVFNPEKKKRHRDGYDEDETHYHTMPAYEFVKAEDPIKCLGAMNAFIWDSKAEPELRTLKKLPETSDEILECFKDLKVLGKKDFRHILKWRKAMREYMDLDKTNDDDEGPVDVEPLDEEEQINREIQDMQERERLKKKRAKRKANEAKQKEILRRQMNMTAPWELGLDTPSNESLFSLKKAEKTGQLGKLVKGKKTMVFDSNQDREDVNMGEEEDDDKEYDSDEALDNLDDQLDNMYEQYKGQRASVDAKYRAKLNREYNDDDEFVGFSDREDDDEDDSDGGRFESDSELDEEEEEQLDSLVSSLKPKEQGLSSKAKRFFSGSLFDDDEDDEGDNGREAAPIAAMVASDSSAAASVGGSEPMEVDDDEVEPETEEQESEDEFEIVSNEPEDDDDWEYRNNDKVQRQTVDIATAEAMTMAHQLATGQKNKHQLMDEGYNKYSFRDTDGLPQWFLDDESKHNKITRPVTKEAAEALKAKMKALNARPIKKVAEAQARKKYKAQQRLEKIRKKSDLIIDDSNMTEREKAEEVQKLVKKLGKQQVKKPKVTVVAAKGKNRAVKGRPKGVKGKYKMVDGVMKKENRALKRIAKKHK